LGNIEREFGERKKEKKGKKGKKGLETKCDRLLSELCLARCMISTSGQSKNEKWPL
jgi:hypothetical protein